MLKKQGYRGWTHYPSNPDKFEFDEEVAKVFDSMAVSAIPMYNEARELTTTIVADRIEQRRREGLQTNILDIGSSTGAFFKTLWPKIEGYPEQQPDITAVALDPSTSMAARIIEDMPHIRTVCGTVDDLHLKVCKYDVINIAYVIQFVPPEQRDSFWETVSDLANEGCMVILSTKERITGTLQHVMDEQYVKFRRNEGYTAEEIEAKTRALRGSMWPEPLGITLEAMAVYDIVPVKSVCKWLHFTTVIAQRV